MLSTITPTFFPQTMDRFGSPFNRGLMSAPSMGMGLRDPFFDMSMRDPFYDMSLRDPFFDMSLRDPFASLDFFDPFNEIDRLAGRNLRWLNEPSILPSRLMQPLVPQKYRITLDCSGFSEDSIKTVVVGNKLEISAKEGDVAAKDTENYTLRELKRTYELPDYVDTSKLVSFMTNNGMLVVEFPWKEDILGTPSLLPKIDENAKTVSLDVVIPPNVDPSRIRVTCRDQDLIVKADYRLTNDDGSTRSRVHYLRRTTLPENTKWDTMKCESDNTKLHITAELGPHHRKRIPITYVGNQPSIQGQQQQPMQT